MKDYKFTLRIKDKDGYLLPKDELLSQIPSIKMMVYLRITSLFIVYPFAFLLFVAAVYMILNAGSEGFIFGIGTVGVVLLLMVREEYYKYTISKLQDIELELLDYLISKLNELPEDEVVEEDEIDVDFSYNNSDANISE